MPDRTLRDVGQLLKQPVHANRRLAPSSDDLRYVKRFLWETAFRTNQRVGKRLAELMEWLHVADPAIFDAQAVANQISQRFGFAVTVNGRVGVV